MQDSANKAGMPAEQVTARGSLNYPIVGIGASGGGLGALLQLLEQMPDAPDMAFLVILQPAPGHPDSPAEILQRATRMPVVEVNARVQIAPGHVYVIGASQQMSMMNGLLLVDERERQRGRHTAIDLLFRTLADVHRERSIAIVLSGSGADGAVGLARIKEQGGVTLAQAPADAEHAGMPMAAIHTGAVDFVLPVADMPQKLIDLWSNARAIELPPAGGDEQPVLQVADAVDASAAERALQEIIGNLLKHTGHDFRHYKRATVLRRIERRLQVRRVANLPAYRDLLGSDATEHKALLADMLIGVTNFFRDREAFDALKREIVPELFSDNAA
jgi:two-component system CheB/CheR fusion protein